MCRAQGEAGCPHGRRCPPNATAREAALKRRRENRAICCPIARWAKAEGKADELAELKRQRKPINEIKEWAGQAGAPESVFARAAGPAKKGWEAAKTELRNDPKAPARRAPARGGAPAAAAAVGALAAPEWPVAAEPSAAQAQAPAATTAPRPRLPAQPRRALADPSGRSGRSSAARKRPRVWRCWWSGRGAPPKSGS